MKKIKSIINKFLCKAGIKENDYSFIYNSIKIDINKNLTALELGIMDSQIIEAIKNNKINQEIKSSYLSDDKSSSDKDSLEDNEIKRTNNFNTSNFIEIIFESGNGWKTQIISNKKETVSNLFRLKIAQSYYLIDNNFYLI